MGDGVRDCAGSWRGVQAAWPSPGTAACCVSRRKRTGRGPAAGRLSPHPRSGVQAVTKPVTAAATRWPARPPRPRHLLTGKIIIKGASLGDDANVTLDADLSGTTSVAIGRTT
jgi:hypothetical protein